MRASRSLTTRAATALLAGSLILAGCGGEEPADDQAAETEDARANDPQTWPLTGLPAEEGEVEKEHPVMAVKIDNSEGSRPQVGLSSADLVVEELVEGGATRLAAFYYSELPDEVGPVRSMRASDIGIVSPVDAAVVTSGAAGVTIDRVKDAGVEFVGEGSKGLYRKDGRPAPYNLFSNLGETASAAERDAERPADYLPWGSSDDLPQGKRATSISANFGSRVSEWSFADGGYVNDNTFTGGGDQFPADTVLVLRVRVGDAGYKDPAGNKVPETKFTGKGQAMLFHDGRLVRGQWSKDSLDAPLQLTRGNGEELTVPAGKTWIELVPKGPGKVQFGK